MGIFSGSSLFDADVEKATDEKNMSENWDAILDVCDKVKAMTTGPKECLRAVLKRLNHTNPNVTKQAVNLLDACVSNCNRPFHLEVASRECEQELRRLLGKLHAQVAAQLRACIKKWAENEFKSDPQLSLIPALYNKLRQEGVEFSGSAEPVKKSFPKDPNVVTSQQEEEDLAKAIELSLKEVKSTSMAASSAPKTTTSLYPSAFSANSSASTSSAPKEPRKVRALYDFEAVEDNELTFKAGEILHVTDDSDQNWWEGVNSRGQGLFPANFVTADLDAEPEVGRDSSKRVQFSEEVSVVADDDISEAEVEIDEAKIDRLWKLITEADPTGERPDPDEMRHLEEQCTAMGPLIDTSLEKLDRNLAQLTKLSADLVQGLELYHSLMRDRPGAPLPNPVLPMPLGAPVTHYGYHHPGMAPGVAAQKYPFDTAPHAPPQSPAMPGSHVAATAAAGPAYGPPSGSYAPQTHPPTAAAPGFQATPQPAPPVGHYGGQLPSQPPAF